MSSCRQRGRDDSGSVTDPRKKAPVLRRAAARGLREDAAGQEQALAGAYRPARGPEEPVCTVIPVSRDRLPLAELGRRHCGQQGREPAFQEPLPDLGLQPPPCRSPAANQGFYLGARIAPLLLPA